LEGIELIKAIKENNRTAQKCLYQKFQEQFFRICYRYTCNVHDAEDLVVDGFMKIFEKIGLLEYRNESSFINWMKTIMINECLMFLRNSRKLLFSEIDLVIEQQNDFELAIELKEIFKVLDSMPVGYRTIFNLFIIEGYTHNEIAAMLKISVQTSKSQLCRAKRNFEKLINELNYERRAV
jgi:RNA polymerase sigma factor (sigma-70 family)